MCKRLYLVSNSKILLTSAWPSLSQTFLKKQEQEQKWLNELWSPKKTHLGHSSWCIFFENLGKAVRCSIMPFTDLLLRILQLFLFVPEEHDSEY